MAWIAVVPHLAAQVWELSSWLLVEGDVHEARGVPKVCSPALNSSLPPCLGCTDVPRCSIHLSSWGEKRGSASAALSGKREKRNLWTEQSLCKQGWRCRSEGVFCKLPVPDLAVQQDHGQRAGALKGHFSVPQFVFQGVLNQFLLS